MMCSDFAVCQASVRPVYDVSRIKEKSHTSKLTMMAIQSLDLNAYAYSVITILLPQLHV